MLRSSFLRTQKATKSNNDGGLKFPPSLCAAEIWFAPARRSFPGNGAVVDPQFPLRPGPQAIFLMKPEHKALASHTNTHFDESVCC